MPNEYRSLSDTVKEALALKKAFGIVSADRVAEPVTAEEPEIILRFNRSTHYTPLFIQD